jgi:hypothetical protein
MMCSGSLRVRVGSRIVSITGRAATRRRRAWGFEPLEGRVVPSTITVMNTHDSGPGSLRAAITQADMDTTQDTIDFAPSVTGTITLLTALPNLTGHTILSGPGASALTVARSAASGTPDFRIFTVNANAQVTISGLTISGGRSAFAGGIENFGMLMVTNSTISGNSASSTGGSTGGGIENETGTLIVTNSTISGNSASSTGFGGGSGGGIDNFGGTLIVTNSTISGNTASGSNSVGGGIWNQATLTLTNSTLSGNSANSGGGIRNTGTVTVTNSTLSGNSATGVGGGIDNLTTVTVTNSTLSGNSANSGGGIDNTGTVTVTNSTLSGNSANSGGGIDIQTPAFGPGGKVTALNSIFANPVGGNLVVAPGATFVSMGHNLFSDAPAVMLDPTDLTNTDPKLGPLANNGGPTQTEALLPGSPAIDAGIAVPGVATDQRGVPRPQGKAPDIGAFELVTGAYAVLTPSTATKLVGTAESLTATVFDPDIKPLAGVPVMFQVTAGPNAGATGTTEPANGQTDANGQVTFTYAGTGGIGTDTIVATATLPDGTRIDSLAASVLWTTLTVTNTNDSGLGSLRAAIAVADEQPGRSTIDFAPAVTGTITLLSALPDLTGQTILSGPGAAVLTVARSAALGTPLFRIFTVDAGAQVAISGLTISGGRLSSGDGGGIDNAGTLMVTNATLSDNSAPAGGGIFNSNSSTLTLTNATLSDNSARTGGGIDNEGTVTVTNATLSGNAAGTFGGGIDNAGTMTLANSTLSGNMAILRDSGAGGGIANSGILTVTNSTLSGNAANLNGGGGIVNFNAGTLTVTNSTLSRNSANSNGGGISNNGRLTVTNATLSRNAASGSNSDGGGIWNQATLTVTNATLSRNTARSGGGGIASFGTLTLTNATLSGNSADTSGGGILSFGTLTLTNSTLSGNSASSDGGGGISEFGPGSKVTAINSIFANLVGGNLVVAPGATFVSLGHNLFSDKPSVPLAPTDLTNTDPLLAPLGDYGGSTETQALLPGSPAIDAGIAVPGVTTDQRGVPRPQGPAPDIGAFEVVVPIKLMPTTGTNLVGQSITVTATLLNQVGTPLAGIPVTFQVTTGPNAGASGTTSPAHGLTDANGQVTFTYTGTGVGTDTIVATATIPGLPAPVSSTALVTWTAPPPAAPPPMVASVQRLGVHQQPTQLLLFFNGPLKPTTAEDTSNYSLTTTGRRQRAIAIDRALYDPTTRSVTLVPHERLSLTSAYQLTVHGGGPHGTDFTTRIFGGGFPRWVGATGPGLSNSPLGNNGPTAAQVDALFARLARINAQRHRR